jgi:hypothetical protein
MGGLTAECDAARYRIWCCREGVVAVPAHLNVEVDQTVGRRVADNSEFILLPRCRTEDELLPQPPLAVTVTRQDLDYMLMSEDHNVNAVAATCFGPKQDKIHNEDFALAAILPGANGPVAFAAIADGVSLKTFWPERSARLACFVAYKVARTMITKSEYWEHPSLLPKIFQSTLLDELKKSLTQDHRILSETAAVPLDWHPGLFKKYETDLTLWYNTTLLVAMVDSRRCLTSSAGDGGIVLQHWRSLDNLGKVDVLLASTDAMEIDEWVALTRDTKFNIRLLELAESRQDVTTVYLATDGVDRSLARQQPPRGLANLILASGPQAVSELREIWENQEADRDNYSAARLTSVPPICFSEIETDRVASGAKEVGPTR